MHVLDVVDFIVRVETPNRNETSTHFLHTIKEDLDDAFKEKIQKAKQRIRVTEYNRCMSGR